MQKTRDFTHGDPLRLILAFSLPMMAGRVFEQLYNLTDTMVIGRVEGITALTAVSASGWLDWLVLSLAMALAEGFSIFAAQRFGARDIPGLKSGVGQSALLALLAAVGLTALSQGFLRPILHLLNTPVETFLPAERYLRVLFSGIIPVMAYNTLSGILRALGNSRTPFAAMVTASLANIAGDILFVAVLHMGVEGAALATVLAQTLSAFICLAALRRIPEVHITGRYLLPDPPVDRKLLLLAAPVALGNLIISIGGLFIQRMVNGYGLVFMAGFNAAGRLSGMMELAGGAIGAGIGAYCGQNKGAGDHMRIQKGVRSAALVAALIAACIGGAVYLFSDEILRLFMEDDPALVEQVLAVGREYLMLLTAAMPALYLLFCFRSALQGMGMTGLAMISGGVELAMRLIVLALLPQLIGRFGVYLSEVSAWIGAMIYLYIAYRTVIRRALTRNA